MTRWSGVFLSTNRGTSWTAVNNGLPPLASANTLAVSGTNLFAGTDGGVFLSTNNGTSWSPANGGFTPATVSSFAASGENLFAGTSGGGVFLSRNNGDTWSPVNTGLTHDNVSGLAVCGTDLFAGTGGDPTGPPTGGIFRSTNNGTSWSDVSSGLTSVRCVAVSGTNVVVGSISNYVGGIFRSTDAGANWTRSDSTVLGNCTVNTFAVIGGKIFAGLSGPGVFLSNDGGATWAKVSSGLPDVALVNCIAVGGTNIFAGTSESGAGDLPRWWGGVFLSTNYGTTWSAVNSGLPLSDPNQAVYAIVASGSNVIASTRLNGVFVSTDSGSSWSRANSGLTDSTVYSFALVGNNLFAGTSGAVWRRPLSEMISSVIVPSGQLPAVFRLEQNYPNPFNPTTTIRYALPTKTHVTLTVFNTLGQQVAELVNGYVDAGIHDVKFDGSGLASGVYYYRLIAGERVDSKKLILMK